jgi:hypothetical protein
MYVPFKLTIIKNCTLIQPYFNKIFSVLTDQQKLLKQLPESARSKIFILDGDEKHWPNNVVPFAFSSKHTPEE